MIRARLTSKAQITVPAVLRRQLGLQPGDELIFDLQPNGEIKVHALKRRPLGDLYAALPASRAYPGKEEIRYQVASDLSRQILNKESKE